MSIALTLVLHPSKKLHFLAILFSSLSAFVAVYIACNAHLPIWGRVAGAGICFGVSIASFYRIQRQNRQKWQISINPSGEIWCQSICLDKKAAGTHDSGARFFVEETTLWPGILFLRLKKIDADNLIHLMIFSDAMDKEQFRQLSVACRWLFNNAK